MITQAQFTLSEKLSLKILKGLRFVVDAPEGFINGETFLRVWAQRDSREAESLIAIESRLAYAGIVFEKHGDKLHLPVQEVRWFAPVDQAGDAHWGLYCEPCVRKEGGDDWQKINEPDKSGYCTKCGKEVA